MTISLDRAVIIALALESCFFGLFTAFFFATLWFLCMKTNPIHTSRRPLVMTVCTMYILALTHLALDVHRAIEGFVDYSAVPRGSLIFYGMLNDPTEIAKNVVYVLQTIVGDFIVIWRCYVVWGRSWYVIVLPIIMLISTAVAGFGTTFVFSQVKPGQKVFIPRLYPWITTYFSLTLATTVMCTSLIAIRIWQSQKALRRVKVQSNLTPVMIILIESGSIYAAALLSVIITYAIKNNGQYVILDFLTSLIGIVFSLIIVRVGLGISSSGKVSVNRWSRGDIDITMPTTTIRSKDEAYLGYHMKSPILPIDGEVSPTSHNLYNNRFYP